jgi:drug/metabolite transporter (DMT)-like permease
VANARACAGDARGRALEHRVRRLRPIGTLAYVAMFRRGGGLTGAGPIAFCGSMVVMVVGVAVFQEPLSLKRAAGLALGIVSIALLR